MPLPPEVASLPTIAAKPWLQVDPEPANALLEGPAFDRQGNLYVCLIGPTAPVRKVLKITPDKIVSEIWASITIAPTGIAIHKDGRLFVACMTGEILIMNPDGSLLTTLEPRYGERMLAANDVVFDATGNLYFTDFSGNLVDPIGGVYRLDAVGDYSTLHQILGNLAAPNGISFSPSGDTLWIGEFGRNAVLRIDLMPDGLTPRPIDGITWPFYSTGGPGGPDSNKVDEAGNLYQCLNLQGRVLILNQFGVPIANVIIPGREEGKHHATTNLAFKPDTNIAYVEAAGNGGCCIYRFPGLAPGLMLYSHR
jgi:lactonase